MYQQKLYGFLGLRSNIRVRVQLNAQPFQAGRLIVAWVPYYKYLGNRTAVFDADTEYGMVALTGCPHIDVDVSQQTECEFDIPYVSNQSHYNLVTGEGYWGKLYIKVYSPLVDPSGTGSVDCTVWFNFVAPQLAFPTGVAIASASVNPTAQVGREEHELEQTRSFSSAVSKFASALRSIPPVPTLDTILEPAAWASDKVADILKLFGLSKPESSNIPSFFKQNPTRFMANSDGVNMSHSLSLLAGNAIEQMSDMVSNNIDEMSIHHLVSTPSYMAHFQWATDDTTNSTLWASPINPSAYFQINSSSATLVPTHLSYTSAAFTFWRGSINFRFKFVKTKFHSGRVRIYFQPGDSNTFTQSNRNYNYSQVVDIRSETEVTFTVPYVNTKPWCRTFATNSSSVDRTGVIHLEVLNELKANTSVSSSIDVLVEVFAGEGFELAGPASPRYQPVLISSAPPSSTAATFLRRITAQVGEVESREDDQGGIVNSDQLGSKVDRTHWIANLAMHGERSVSLRQLIKRSSLEVSTNLTVPSISIAPFSPRLNYTRNQTDNPTTQPKSYLDYFGNLYAFWRGSVNLKIISSTFQQAHVTTEAMLSWPDLSGSITWPSQSSLISTTVPAHNSSTSTPVQVIFQELEGCIDIHCPYYNVVHMSPVSDYTFNDNNVALGMYPPYLVRVSGLPNDEYYIYRSACDDFQFGYLIGTPLCERVNG